MCQRVFYRTVHAVGQGLFCTEIIQSKYHQEGYINVVYDCGTLSNQKNIEQIISTCFNHGDSIDYLFISHFDEDHINKIPLLKKKYTINNVVLPLLHKNEAIIIKSFYKALGLDDLYELVSDPKKYFGPNTNLYFVKPYIDGLEDAISELPNNKDNGVIIDSGTPLIMGNPNKQNKDPINDKDDEWVFIPYNVMHHNRSKQLIKSLIEKRIDKDIFSYFDASNNKDAEKARKEKIRKLRSVYNKLKNGINSNSLVLYSGDISEIDIKKAKKMMANNNSYNNAGCVYTGDSSFKDYQISMIFKSVLGQIKLIQIPHHGRKTSFCCKFLNGIPSSNKVELFVSFNTKWKKSESAKEIIASLLGKNMVVHQVTEDYSSTYRKKTVLYLKQCTSTCRKRFKCPTIKPQTDSQTLHLP